ncbi:hypothetical protein [Conexibacter sp. SYSU D00693]|uniref:hypothetical protein n=1 Tax=Conexibacter sp. SYSU D00693 TaxID=2812560 RepID=UPI00196BA4A6|nr:hypothetical protein [Conexibacter sp. SYSU D00693]
MRRGAVTTLAVLAAMALGGLATPGTTGGGSSAGASDTAKADAWRVARQFVRALRLGDAARLCAVAAQPLRDADAGPCTAPVQDLAGPTPKVLPPVMGKHAAEVRVRRRPAPTLTVSLVRERGRWAVSGLDGR